MDDPTPPDHLVLQGLGGFFNGELFAVPAGESATIGATSLADFPVTLCRNHRRAAEDPSRPHVLARMAPRHVRVLYLGGGRLVVENLAGRDVSVGWRDVPDRLEVDLGKGAVEIAFAYGERFTATFPGSPAVLQELAPHEAESAAVAGVFMALFSAGGDGLGPLARRAAPAESAEYELVEAPDESDPGHETGPIAGIPPPTPGKGRAKARRRFGRPFFLLSVLVHLTAALGLFAWIVTRPEPPAPLPVAIALRTPISRVAPAFEEPAEMPAREDPAAAATAAVDPTPSPAPVGGESAPPLPAMAGAGPGGDAAAEVLPAIGGSIGAPSFVDAPAASDATVRSAPAVARALAWLVDHQSEDGGWRAAGGLAACNRCDDPGSGEYEVATTSLALLAFLEAGHTYREGAHRETVVAGLRWLVRRQQADGSFHPPDLAEADRPLYGDSLAVLALAKAHRATETPLLLAPLKRGVRRLVAVQTPYAGWRYAPADRDSDTSVTAWAALALAAAREAGVDVNPAAFTGIELWLEAATDPASGRVGYRARGRGSPGMTSAAVAARLALGHAPSTPEVRHGLAILRENPPAFPEAESKAPGNPPDLLHLVFTTFAARQAGDSALRRAAGEAAEALATRQVRAAHESGSFTPYCRWSKVGGRVVATALATLALATAPD